MATAQLRAPGQWSTGRHEAFAGWVALTQRRLVAYGFSRRLLHIGTDDPRLRDLVVDVPRPDRLVLTFQLFDFHDDRRGRCELRFDTPEANRLHDRLVALGCARGGSSGAPPN